MKKFLCGFKKSKSKGYPHEQPISGEKDRINETKKDKPDTKMDGKMVEQNVHEEISGVVPINHNSKYILNGSRSINGLIMTSDHTEDKTTVHTQDGGQIIQEIVKLSYPIKKQDQAWTKAELERGQPGPDSRAIIVPSYREKQDIDRLAEEIMSGKRITSLDITGQGSAEDQKRNPDSQTSPLNPQGNEPETPLPDYEMSKMYITADQMQHGDFYYKMNHPRRGRCLIVNIGEFLPITRMQNRKGYLVDGELMRGTFTRLGFDVQYVKNPTSLKLKDILEEVAVEDHKNVDCFAMVIMSHGNRDHGDLIFTKDSIMHLDFIMEYFNGRGCPQLAGKPKLFFIQACRGDKLDDGQELPFIDDDMDELDAAQGAPRIPIEADILLSQATSPGYISFRNSEKGSIYIRCLTKALTEFGYTEDLLSVLTRVNAMVAFEFQSNSLSKVEFHAKKQMPTFTCQLTKKLQFEPPRKK